MRSMRLGELSTVGADALNDPQRVKVSAGAPTGPVDCPGQTSLGRGEDLLVDDSTSRGQDGQGVVSAVGVGTDDERVGMRDDTSW